MGNQIKIANLNDVPPGQASAFEVDGRSIALFNVDGTFYAIDDTCPHSGGPLSEGEVADGKVTCPWHSASFDLKTGEVLSPPADEAVKSYKVVVEGQDVKVEI
jgi:nitrite reductase/ring-hydroxylating ferredoxin subunit